MGSVYKYDPAALAWQPAARYMKGAQSDRACAHLLPIVVAGVCNVKVVGPISAPSIANVLMNRLRSVDGKG